MLVMTLTDVQRGPSRELERRSWTNISVMTKLLNVFNIQEDEGDFSSYDIIVTFGMYRNVHTVSWNNRMKETSVLGADFPDEQETYKKMKPQGESFSIPCTMVPTALECIKALTHKTIIEVTQEYYQGVFVGERRYSFVLPCCKTETDSSYYGADVSVDKRVMQVMPENDKIKEMGITPRKEFSLVKLLGEMVLENKAKEKPVRVLWIGTGRGNHALLIMETFEKFVRLSQVSGVNLFPLSGHVKSEDLEAWLSNRAKEALRYEKGYWKKRNIWKEGPVIDALTIEADMKAISKEKQGLFAQKFKCHAMVFFPKMWKKIFLALTFLASMAAGELLYRRTNNLISVIKFAFPALSRFLLEIAERFRGHSLRLKHSSSQKERLEFRAFQMRKSDGYSYQDIRENVERIFCKIKKCPECSFCDQGSFCNKRLISLIRVFFNSAHVHTTMEEWGKYTSCMRSLRSDDPRYEKTIFKIDSVHLHPDRNKRRSKTPFQIEFQKRVDDIHSTRDEMNLETTGYSYEYRRNYPREKK